MSVISLWRSWLFIPISGLYICTKWMCRNILNWGGITLFVIIYAKAHSVLLSLLTRIHTYMAVQHVRVTGWAGKQLSFSGLYRLYLHLTVSVVLCFHIVICNVYLLFNIALHFLETAPLTFATGCKIKWLLLKHIGDAVELHDVCYLDSKCHY